MFTFAHYNFNVINLEKSLAFYEQALGLKEVRRVNAKDGSFTLVYLGDSKSDFTLELTWLRDWEKPQYNLGDNEIHLAMRTDDYAKAKELHDKIGCICFDNEAIGIYFICDPDGYWIEILPPR